MSDRAVLALLVVIIMLITFTAMCAICCFAEESRDMDVFYPLDSWVWWIRDILRKNWS